MPTLPVQRATNDAFGRRKRTGALPDAGDVTTISPDVGRVRPIDAPQGAFRSTTGLAAEGLAPGISDLGEGFEAEDKRIREIEAKMQSREDTLTRVQALTNIKKRIAEDNRQRDAEINNPDPISAFERGQNMRRIIDEEAENLPGSEESRLTLLAQAEEIFATESGKQAVFLAELAKTKGKTLINDANATSFENLSELPNANTQGLAKAHQAIINNHSNVQNIFDVGESEELLKKDLALASNTLANTLFNHGRIEQLSAMLRTDAMRTTLSAEDRTKNFDRIQKFREGGSALREKIRVLEEAGIEITPQLLKNITGAGNTGKRADLELLDELGGGKNLTPEQKRVLNIEDIGAGKTVTPPDAKGNQSIINKVDGTRTPVTDEGVPAQPPAQVPVDTAPTNRKNTLVDDIKKGTGSISAIQAFLAATVGIGFEDGINKDTTDARAKIRGFVQTFMQGFQSGDGKFAIAEQKNIRAFLPDPDEFFNNPANVASSLVKLKENLTELKEANLKELNTGDLTTKKEAEILDRISDINRGLNRLPDFSGKGSLPEGLPEGSEKIGEKNGNPVYETEDGDRFEVRTVFSQGNSDSDPEKKK